MRIAELISITWFFLFSEQLTLFVNGSAVAHSSRHHVSDRRVKSFSQEWFPLGTSPSSGVGRRFRMNAIDSFNLFDSVVLTSSTPRKKRRRKDDKPEDPSRMFESQRITNFDRTGDLETKFQDLGPIGKTIAGCTEIVFVTLTNCISGYMSGLFFGTLVGTPGFLFRPIETSVRRPLMEEMKLRFVRMNTRSVSWGKSLAGVSAAFGGFDVAVKVLRNGKEDFWSQILSSAFAGAYFARKEGTQAMVRGAITYGALVYALTVVSRKGSGVQEYVDRPVVMKSSDLTIKK